MTISKEDIDGIKEYNLIIQTYQHIHYVIVYSYMV